MKKYWLASIVEDNGKFYAYGVVLKDNENVVAVIEDRKLHVANICPTKKAMRETVEYWNSQFRVNGTYMFPYEW